MGGTQVRFLWSTVFTFLCETHCFIEVSWELIVHFSVQNSLCIGVLDVSFIEHFP